MEERTPMNEQEALAFAANLEQSIDRKPGTIPVRLALVCGECGADMRRVDATETHNIYRCDGPYGHEYHQPRLALRYRSTTRNNSPLDAA